MRLHDDPDIAQVVPFTSLVLLYLEQTELVPERFSPGSRAAWRGVMPYLRELDLFELAVRDGVRANPHLFAAFRDPTARNELRALDERVWQQELQQLQSLNLAQTLRGDTTLQREVAARCEELSRQQGVAVNTEQYIHTAATVYILNALFTLAEEAQDKTPFYRWVARLISLPEEAPDIEDAEVREGIRSIIGDVEPYPYVVMG